MRRDKLSGMMNQTMKASKTCTAVPKKNTDMAEPDARIIKEPMVGPNAIPININPIAKENMRDRVLGSEQSARYALTAAVALDMPNGGLY